MCEAIATHVRRRIQSVTVFGTPRAAAIAAVFGVTAVLHGCVRVVDGPMQVAGALAIFGWRTAAARCLDGRIGDNGARARHIV